MQFPSILKKDSPMDTNSNNRVGLLTEIHPRFDMDHLGEWLRHHAALGIKNFWFCTGQVRSLSQCIANGQVGTWNKSRGADPHDDFDDHSCARRVRNIIKTSRRRYGVSVDLIQTESESLQSQIKRQRKRRPSNVSRSTVRSVEWLAKIDSDELVVGDLKFLTRLSPQISVVQLQTRRFESRWYDGKARPLAAVDRLLGLGDSCTKSFVRSSQLSSLPNLRKTSRKPSSATIVMPNQKLRLHRFREHRVRDGRTPDRRPPAQRNAERLTDRSHQPRFDVIVGTMRSGSSLLGHVLNQLGYGRYAGETHTRVTCEEQIQKVIATIDDTVSRDVPLSRPSLEKIIHLGLVGGDDFLWKRVGRIYLLHRHPAPVCRSLIELTRGRRQVTDLMMYLVEHYRWLIGIAEGKYQSKIWPVSYYDLVDSERFLKRFGRPIERYRLLPMTGKPRWGDPTKLITTGRIQARDEQLEIRDALHQLDPAPDQLKTCMSLYSKLLDALPCKSDTRMHER